MKITNLAGAKLESFACRWMAPLAMGLVFIVGPALAEDHEEKSFDIETITCWDLTGVEEEAQAPALMMVFGYVAGVHGIKEHKGDEIGPALERVGKLCEANPDMYAVSAMERAILPK